MADVILYLFYRFSETLKQRYPDGFTKPFVADNMKMEDAIFHFNWYNGIGGHLNTVAAVLAFGVSAWWLLLLLGHGALAAQAVHRELIVDGHLKRIKDGTETPEQLLDMKADLITRGAGLLIPIAGAVAVAACRMAIGG